MACSPTIPVYDPIDEVRNCIGSWLLDRGAETIAAFVAEHDADCPLARLYGALGADLAGAAGPFMGRTIAAWGPDGVGVLPAMDPTTSAVSTVFAPIDAAVLADMERFAAMCPADAPVAGARWTYDDSMPRLPRGATR